MGASVGQAEPLEHSGDQGWRSLGGRARQVARDASAGSQGSPGGTTGSSPGAAVAAAVDAPSRLPVAVILSGGRGTRLQEHTRWIPKPLVEVGGRPIVWHVMQIFIAQGFRQFLLLTGYKAKLVDSFVDQQRWPDGVEVCCLDTGEDTPTAGRLIKAASSIADESFCLTYADGVADIDLGALLACHAGHNALATMTVVQPELQFGVAVMNGDGLISRFVEKPRFEQWINGGFFCFDRSVFEVLEESEMLEREPLERLAAAGQLQAFRHNGFWDCMDTYKDVVLLGDLWAQGRAPWKLWD